MRVDCKAYSLELTRMEAMAYSGISGGACLVLLHFSWKYRVLPYYEVVRLREPAACRQ